MYFPRQNDKLTIPPGGGNVNLTIDSLSPRPDESSQQYLEAIKPCWEMPNSDKGWVNGTLAFALHLDQEYDLTSLISKADEANVRVTQLVLHGLRLDPRRGWITYDRPPNLLVGGNASSTNPDSLFDVRVWEPQPVPGGVLPICARVTYTVDLNDTKFKAGGDKIDHLVFRDVQVPPSVGDRMGVTAIWAVVESNNASAFESTQSTATNSNANTTPVSSQMPGYRGSVSAGVLVAALVTPTICALLGVLILYCLRRRKQKQTPVYWDRLRSPTGRWNELSSVTTFVPEPHHVSSPLSFHSQSQPDSIARISDDIASHNREHTLSSARSPSPLSVGEIRTTAEQAPPDSSDSRISNPPALRESPLRDVRPLPELPALSETQQKGDNMRVNELVNAMEVAGFTVETLFDKLNRRPPSVGVTEGGMTELPDYDQVTIQRV